jgi:hypothetical protein
MPASQFFEFEFLFDDDSEAKGKDLDFDWNAEDDRLSHRLECDYMNKDPVREKLSAPAINTSTEGGQRAHLPLPQQYDFALVADLDKGSRDPKKFEWHSIMQVRACFCFLQQPSLRNSLLNNNTCSSTRAESDAEAKRARQLYHRVGRNHQVRD